MPLILLVPLHFLPWNPIYPVMMSLVVGAIASVVCRPDLWKKTVIGGFLFLGIYAVFMLSLVWLAPDYVERVWNLAALKGGLIHGIPTEELLFGFAFGLYWTGVYEHFTWSKSATHAPLTTPRIALVTLMTLAVISAACRESTVTPLAIANQNSPSSPAVNSEGYTVVTASELANMLPAKKFTMINVHTPFEGEIPQTDFNIPFDRIAGNLDRLPAKDAAILIYCRSGRMSTDATLTLTRLGYSHVMHLEGGFNAWKAAGKEMVKQP